MGGFNETVKKTASKILREKLSDLCRFVVLLDGIVDKKGDIEFGGLFGDEERSEYVVAKYDPKSQELTVKILGWEEMYSNLLQELKEEQ